MRQRFLAHSSVPTSDSASGSSDVGTTATVEEFAPSTAGPFSFLKGRLFKQDAGRQPTVARLAAPYLSRLSGHLLAMTVMLVLVAEMVIFVPSIAKYRRDQLMTTITSVQIAALVERAGENARRHEDLERNLLKRLGVITVVLNQHGNDEVLLSAGPRPAAARTVVLANGDRWPQIVQAIDALIASDDRVLKVISTNSRDMGGRLTVYMYERRVRQAMLAHSLNILGLSLVIAIVVSGGVYWALRYVAVKPIRRIITSMMQFRENPEDASRIIKPREKGTELAEAERALADLQIQVRAALQQKSRLAALGTAVSKINHDLRNILASTQLISERLAAIDDPGVRAMAPKLLTALDRAINLCTNTLRFGRAEEPPPDLKYFLLSDLVCDVATMLDLQDHERIAWRMDVDGPVTVYADPDHVFRVLLNLVRNAVQAVEATEDERRAEIILRARLEKESVIIEVEDTGPGIPERARAHLFEAFVSSARDGGTGLGLAIAAELVQANGGRIELIRSDAQGTLFRLSLPRREPA